MATPFVVTQVQGIEAEALFSGLSAIVEERLSSFAANFRASSDPDELLTRDEVAAVLKVSTVTVWAWSNAGILQPYKIGNKVRFKRSEVLGAAKAIESKKGGATDE